MPERMPVPYRLKHIADSTKTAYRLRTLLSKYETELLNIHHQHIPTILDTRRNSLEESIIGMLGRIESTQSFDIYPHHSLISKE